MGYWALVDVLCWGRRKKEENKQGKSVWVWASGPNENNEEEKEYEL